MPLELLLAGLSFGLLSLAIALDNLQPPREDP
jgi:hypothetical protein